MYDITPIEALDFHHSMLVDQVRTDSFMQAILETVNPGDVVLDLGSGTGILTCLACMAGAKHVYAVEKKGIIHAAREIIELNDLSQRVTFLNAWSTEITLPELADVLITETVGNIGFEEGILRWVHDARLRLLQEDARIIPQKVAMIAAPVEDEKIFWQVETWMKEDLYTYDFSPLHKLSANNMWWIDLEPEMLRAKPATIAEVDLRQVTETDIAGDAAFIISKDGLVHGLGAWFTADLTPLIRLSNEPPSNVPSWSHMLLPLERPLAVKEGESLHVRIFSSQQAAHWHWQVSHYPQPAEGQEPHCIVLPPGSTKMGQLLPRDK